MYTEIIKSDARTSETCVRSIREAARFMGVSEATINRHLAAVVLSQIYDSSPEDFLLIGLLGQQSQRCILPVSAIV